MQYTNTENKNQTNETHFFTHNHFFFDQISSPLEEVEFDESQIHLYDELSMLDQSQDGCYFYHSDKNENPYVLEQEDSEPENLSWDSLDDSDYCQSFNLLWDTIYPYTQELHVEFLTASDMTPYHDDSFGICSLISNLNQVFAKNYSFLSEVAPEHLSLMLASMPTILGDAMNNWCENSDRACAEFQVEFVNKIFFQYLKDNNMIWFVNSNPNSGHDDFVRYGGESNPGPAMSTLLTSAVRAGFRFVCPEYTQWLNSITETINITKAYGFTLVHVMRLYTSMVDVMSTFLYRGVAITSLDLYTRVIIFLLNLYETFKTMSTEMGLTVGFTPPTRPQAPLMARPQAGPLETFCMATFLSAALPKCLHGIIKDIPTFTQFKLLDDATWIFDLFSFIVGLPLKMCNLVLPRNEKTEFVFFFLERIELNLPFSSLSKHHYYVKLILDEYASNPRIASSPDFQIRMEAVYKQYLTFKQRFLSDKKELPPFMQSHDRRITSLNTKIQYMKTNIRVEPVACVFGGLRGTGKTTLMNMLVAGFSYDNTVYTHQSQEDKDFHDQYDDEDMYVYDDVGQKGPWQWSGFINFVSTTKCPLICAEAEKKGTKFFTSKLIMASTNNINITLTANCGISDIGALHRRLINFEFANVRFVEGQYSGYISVNKYDLTRNCWMEIGQFLAREGKFDLQAIGDFIKDEMKKKRDNMTIYANPINLGAFPQSDNITDYALGRTLYNLDNPPVLPPPVRRTPPTIKDQIKQVMLYMEEQFSRVSDFVKDTVSFCSEQESSFRSEFLAKYGHVMSIERLYVTLGCLASAFVYSLTVMYDEYKKWRSEEVSTVGKKTNHYIANRKPKLSIKSAMPQSLRSLFELQRTFVEIPQLERIQNHSVAVQVDFLRGDKTISKCFSSTIAGRYILAPLHALNLEVEDKVRVTVYRGPDSIYYDKISCRVCYVNFKDDVAVLELPLYLPKYFGNLKFTDDTSVIDLVLVTPSGVIDLNESLNIRDCRITYKDFDTGYHGTIVGETSVVYDEEFDGLCGSLLLTRDGVLLGHHVAQVISSESERAYGCAKLFSQKTVNKIRELMDEKVDYIVKCSKKVAQGSIVKVDDRVYHHVGDKSKYVQSEMYGVFEEVRAPANLNVYGRETVKILSEKGRQSVASLDERSLNYAHDYVDDLMPFAKDVLTEKEIVLGNLELNKIDPNSSVGYGLIGTKRDHLDYNEGKIGLEVKKQIQTFTSRICDGTYNFDTYYAESLKDELKDMHKINKPRVFKAGPLLLTLLYRFFFGELITKVSIQKMKNGVMIGINPLGDEWDSFAKRVVSFSPKIFDGDWKSWDGGMLTQVQQDICSIMKDKTFDYKHVYNFNGIFGTRLSSTEYEKVFDMSLTLLYNTPTITLDEAFITTHSMPSGCAVTAFFNSWVNKAYGAYVFNQLYVKQFNRFPPADEYNKKVFDCVYGDDKVTSVKEDIADWFNGRTFSTEAKRMGLDFTPADKGEWKYDTRSLYDCSFLKRGFYFHPLIGRIVAPLDEISMKGTMNYVSDLFRRSDLTEEKITNFQRECFLHYDKYDTLMNKVINYAQEKKVFAPILNERTLIKLYIEGDYGNELILS